MPIQSSPFRQSESPHSASLCGLPSQVHGGTSESESGPNLTNTSMAFTLSQVSFKFHSNVTVLQSQTINTCGLLTTCCLRAEGSRAHGLVCLLNLLHLHILHSRRRTILTIDLRWSSKPGDCVPRCRWQPLLWRIALCPGSVCVCGTSACAHVCVLCVVCVCAHRDA